MQIEKPEHNGSHEEEKTAHLHWLDQYQWKPLWFIFQDNEPYLFDHLRYCCSNFTDKHFVPNLLFIYMCIKFYPQAVLQAHTWHLGRIITWVGIWIFVVKCKTWAKFIEDFLLLNEKKCRNKRCIETNLNSFTDITCVLVVLGKAAFP